MAGAFFILDDPIFSGLAVSLIFGIFVSTVLTLQQPTLGTDSPLGQKSKYVINDINLMGEGDILLLFSDGFMEHGEHTMGPFGERRLEPILRETKDQTAAGIAAVLKTELMGYAESTDDMSFVVIKRKKK